LKKLIAEDGGVAENKLMKVPKNLIFITHQLLDTSEIIRKSTKAQCYQIICTRHPIYLFHHWRSYIKLFGNSPRDFTLWQKFHNSELPWFIESKSLWNTGNYDEKTIIAISDLTDRLLKYHNLMRNQEQIFFLEFEKLVLGRINIYQSLSRIGFNFPSSFNSVLRKEKVPRKHLNEGKNRKIYQRYHANMLNNFSDHKSDYMQLRSVILKRVRKKYGTIFEKTIEKYEKNFELWF
jgi:hypothetical protein